MNSETRLPPNDNDAEEAVIGSLLIDGDAIKKVENTIAPDDFYHEANRWLYQGCVNLRGRREAINQVTLSRETDRLGRMDLCGGSSHLSYLISICPTSIDIEHYAAIVRRLSVARQMILLGDSVAGVGYEQLPDVNEGIAKITEIFREFRDRTTVFDDLVSPKDAANVIFDMVAEYNEPRHGYMWGFRDIDEMVGGLSPELVIIGARPSVGKTQLMLDIMENFIEQGMRVLFCSVEMMIKSLLERKIAREIRVDIRRLRKCGLEPDVVDKIVKLAGVVSEQQVYYLPQGITSQDVYNQALKLKETVGLDAVFVDYLQILKDCWQTGRESKNVLVGRASKVLKSLVNDLEIPVICASQLSRDLERRSEEQQKPKLADLRESGDIEQDADVVLLLWRDMNNLEEEVRNVLEVKMAKHRQLGDSPAVKLIWRPGEYKYVSAYLGEEATLF